MQNAYWLNALVVLVLVVAGCSSPSNNSGLTDVHEISEQQCQSGNANACHVLGRVFAEGRGVSVNQSEAFRYHEIACNLNNLASCSEVASAYIEGRGVQQNSQTAALIYRSNCDLGASGDCALLGMYYASGLNGLHNYSVGMELLDTACELASEIGCLWAQQALEIHGGQALDIQRYARRHFALIEEGCYGTKPRACYALGDLYMNSEHVERDASAAQSAFAQGCSSGHELSCRALVQLPEE
jgi:TPR repeat protein